MITLQIGDIAPDFTVLDQDGKSVSKKDFEGKKFVIFFYPKDNTPTCTTEACNLRDNYTTLQKAGYEIIGVSPDSPKRHTNFIEKFSLPYTLLADTEKIMSNAYEVWGPKRFMGLDLIGMHRTTFVIDEKGKIEKIIRKVKSKNHTDQILSPEE